MTRIREIKTTFTAGEVSRELLGRGDLRAYENGALKLQNVFINPTGGVTRRAGLNYIDTAAGPGRLIAFEFNTAQTYLLVVTDGQIAVYAGGVLDEIIPAPWTAGQIAQLAWTQSADTLLLTHPDVPPKKLTRGADASWTLSDWEFFTDGGILYQPYFKFAASAVTLAPSATSGTITLTASAPIFTADHENTRLRVGGKEVEITDYDSPTVVTANVIQTLSGTSATIDWEEQAFSAARGYPVTVAFHQDRLVIGGSRDLPNRLWFSKSGDLFNFDLGTGLDDEAIEFSVLSDQVNAIRGIFSGRHLQVFTSGAGSGRRARLVQGIFRLQDTAALRLDVGRGPVDIALRQLGEEEILDGPPPLVSGDIKVRALGWQNDATKPLWRIEQSVPLPFTLLSVTTELKVND